MRTNSTGLLLLTALLAAAILYLTLMPVTAPGPRGTDKLYHMLAFAALVLPTALLRPSWLVPMALLALGLGAFIEIVQPLVGRDGSFADLAADAAGIALASAAGLAARRMS